MRGDNAATATSQIQNFGAARETSMKAIEPRLFKQRLVSSLFKLRSMCLVNALRILSDLLQWLFTDHVS